MAAISVIIPTYNGAATIRKTLAALARQSFRDFEVVVVVDGSTDDTFDILTKITKNFPTLHFFNIENQGRAGARNRAVEKSTSELLLFVDDDVELFENAVELHYDFLKKNPSSISVGSLTMERMESGANKDFFDYRLAVESSGAAAVEQAVSFTNYIFTTANLSMARRTFDLVGGFDPLLRDSEDFDFCARALEANFRINYYPVISGYHDDHLDVWQYVLRRREYLRSKYVLLKIRPHFRTLLAAQFEWMDPRTWDGVKRIVFGNYTFWLWFFNTATFHFLPKTLRYRLYSGFIYVHTSLTARTTRDSE